jgi:outer membrane protein
MQIGTVNLVRILDDSKRGQALSKKLQGIAEKWQQDLTTVQQRLQNTQERIQKGGAALQPDVAFKLQRDARIYEIELRSLQERLRLDIETHREHYRKQLLDEIHPLVRALADEKGCEVVVAEGSQQVLYAKGAVDLTPSLLARMDAT